MDKERLNFRFPAHLSRQMKRDAERRGETHTEWVVDACRRKLKAQKEEMEVRDESDNEEIKKIKERLNSLSDIIDYCTYSVEQHDDRIVRLINVVESMKEMMELMGVNDDVADEELDNLRKTMSDIENLKAEDEYGDQ